MLRVFLFKLIIGLFVVYSSIFIIVNIFIDPYNEIGLVKYSMNKNIFQDSLLTYNTILKNLKNDHYTIVFGTSRSHLLSEEVLNDKVLNLHSLYGNPKNIFNVLNKLSKVEISNINKVYYLLDFHVFNTDTYRKFDTSNFLPQIYYLIRNTNSIKIVDSLKLLVLNMTGKYNSYIDRESGSAVMKDSIEMEFINLEYKPYLEYNKEVYSYLSKIDNFFKKHNIEVVYFTPPLYSGVLKNFDLDILKKQKELYLDHIDGFYDFTYVESISDDESMFKDVTHLNIEGMKLIVKKIQVQNDYYITKETLDKLQAKLNNRDTKIE